MVEYQQDNLIAMQSVSAISVKSNMYIYVVSLFFSTSQQIS